MTKTIFITSFHAHISRNILATDALSILKAENNLRLVIVVPDYKIDYFKTHFGGGNVFIEGVPLYQASKKISGLFFKRLSFFLFDSQTRRLKKRYKYYHDRKLFYFAVAMALGFLSHFPLIRNGARFLDLRLASKEFFFPLIQKYSPDLVFSTDVQNENDVALLQAARLRGIPTIGMFRSWDNPTQSLLRIFPDKFFVGSDEVKRETVKLQRYPAEKIIVTGNPHYDRYLSGPAKTKKDFFAEFNLDPNRKLILYAPVGDKSVYYNDIDQFIMEILGTIDAQILVRFPPVETLTLNNFKKPDNMIFDRPGFVFRSEKFADREIRPADDRRLVNSIYWSDLTVSGSASICLDAALLDKPVISVNISPTRRHFFRTLYGYKFDHIQKLLGTGGVRSATSESELLKAIQDYFHDSRRDAAGRAKIRSLWFSHADGASSARLVHELTSFSL